MAVFWRVLCGTFFSTLSGFSSDRVGVMGSERLLSPGVASVQLEYALVRECLSFGLRAFRVTVSVVVGSGRLFAALVLLVGVVCIGVDGQFPAPRCTLYSGCSGCAPNPFVTVEAMYLALVTSDALRLAFHRPTMSR